MGYHRPDISNAKRDIKIEIISNYNEFLKDLEKEHMINFTHEIRKQHFEFFNICYEYMGDIHGINSYLNEKGYNMIYNIGIGKIDEIVKLEKENLAKGIYLIGAFFNHDHELLRFIIGKRELLLTLVIDNVKVLVSNINLNIRNCRN